MRTAKGWASILILLGASIYLYEAWWYPSRTWMPISMPISLRAGSLQTAPFQVNLDERFNIDISVDHETPDRLTNDVLGVPDLENAPKRPLEFKWVVKENGIPIQMGESGRNDWFVGRRRGRRIGFFSAKPRKNYQVEVQTLADGSQLDSFHPRLDISVDLFKRDGYAISNEMKSFAGGILFGLGTLLVFFSILKNRWQRNRISTPVH